jgi:hypothetical protein
MDLQLKMYLMAHRILLVLCLSRCDKTMSSLKTLNVYVPSF